VRVLVADDDRSIGLALQMALEDLGHECLVAGDGSTAWELFQSQGADAIISDWRMPGLEGPDLCRKVRAEHGQPYAYFVILTVYNEPNRVLEGMEAGADDFLTKPFTLDSLQARLIAAERVTSLHRDLIDRHEDLLRASTERDQALQRLEREHSHLEAVIKQMPAGVVIASAPSGEIVMVNDQIGEIWQAPDTDETSVLQHRVAGTHPDGRPYTVDDWPLSRSIRTGEVIAGEEVSIVRRDGSAGTIRISSAPIYDGETITAAVAVIDDVTETRRRQQQAVQSEKLRALGQLAGGVAHDLNQSLTLVAGYADVALMALDEDVPGKLDELRDMLRIMARAAYDGGETVKSLLTFSRSAPDGPAESFEVATLLTEVARLTAPRWRGASQAQGRPIALTVDAQPAMLLDGWAPSLREALINLIFNAVDALPSGGDIVLRAHAEAETVVVEVSDSGTGMPPEVQARIFEPFFTTKGEHGTGLGLPMVFGVVERHRGTVEVQSAAGQGTTIRLRLPLTQQHLAAPVTPITADAGTPQRILVVDDEPAIRQMLERILKLDGHSVITAASGEEALVLLATQGFDVLISDIGLGSGMNGWEVVDRVHVQWPGLRVMLVSGWGAEIDPDEAAARGVEAVLSKPYRFADLRRAIAASVRSPS
jgi:signal transduction histidine kinase